MFCQQFFLRLWIEIFGLVLWGSWCRRHPLLLHQLYVRRLRHPAASLYVFLTLRRLRHSANNLSVLQTSLHLRHTVVLLLCILHPRRHVVRGIPPINLRELRVLRPPRPFATTSRRIQTTAFSAPHRRDTPSLLAAQQFNRAEVQPRRCPTAPLCSRSSYHRILQLLQFPCYCSYVTSTFTYADTASRAILPAKFYG